MKKKVFWSFLIAIICYYFYSFTTLSEKYKMINEIASDNNLMLSEICSESVSIEILENNLSEFSFLDQLSVNAQKVTQFTHYFEDDELKYFDRKSKKTKPVVIIQDCKNHNRIFHRISLPIISADKKTAIIKITEDCNCLLGGQSGAYLYKKINGKWVKIKTFTRWIS